MRETLNTCSECYADVDADNASKHAKWHREMETKIVEAAKAATMKHLDEVAADAARRRR